MTDTGEILDLSKEFALPLTVPNLLTPMLWKLLLLLLNHISFDLSRCFVHSVWPNFHLGGSFPPPMRGMATDAVNRTFLKRKGLPARQILPLKEPVVFPCLAVRYPGSKCAFAIQATGAFRGLREVGELEIRGTSVMTGYYKRPDLNDTLFHDGWLRTGDLAYFVEGPDGGAPELVLCGRIKDVIIIAGRNIFPEDIERSIGKLKVSGQVTLLLLALKGISVKKQSLLLQKQGQMILPLFEKKSVNRLSP
jgi:hypothetical protein